MALKRYTINIIRRIDKAMTELWPLKVRCVSYSSVSCIRDLRAADIDLSSLILLTGQKTHIFGPIYIWWKSRQKIELFVITYCTVRFWWNRARLLFTSKLRIDWLGNASNVNWDNNSGIMLLVFSSTHSCLTDGSDRNILVFLYILSFYQARPKSRYLE